MPDSAKTAAAAKPETGEVASVAKDIYLHAFSGLLRPNDDTLATRGQGRGLKIYDELERDAQIFGDLQKRKLAVIARDWQVDPASDAAADVAAADLVRAQLEALNFDQLCLNLLDALLKGFAVGEIIWAVDGSQIMATEVIPRDQRRFVFAPDKSLRLLTPAAMSQGEVLPDRKFIVHRCGAKDGNPYGLGLGTRLFWPAYFKRQDITFWLTFADKFGSPTAVGKYPAGTSEKEKATLLAAISAIAQDSAITFPEGMVVELLEAQRSGATDAYEKLARYMDEQISKIILGESESMRSKAGALAAGSEIRNEVRLELTQADSDLLSDTLNKTLIRWICEYNIPNAVPPKVWRDVSAPEDLKTRAERDKIIVDMGFRPTLEYIQETYGEGFELAPPPAALPPPFVPQGLPPGRQGGRKGDLPPQPNDPATTTAFAEGDPSTYPDQQALDKAIDAIPAQALQAQMQTILAPVLAILNSSTDALEALGKLAEAYPNMDSSKLEDLLARAMFVSDVWGRLNGNADASA